eukprot:11206629-Lingulodinium_polyedra.AAC.1
MPKRPPAPNAKSRPANCRSCCNAPSAAGRARGVGPSMVYRRRSRQCSSRATTLGQNGYGPARAPRMACVAKKTPSPTQVITILLHGT